MDKPGKLDLSDKAGKPRVINGKLFVLAELHRRLTAMGVDISKTALHRYFSERPDYRIDPSFKRFRAIAAALGLSLDETAALIDRVRAANCRRVGEY